MEKKLGLGTSGKIFLCHHFYHFQHTYTSAHGYTPEDHPRENGKILMQKFEGFIIYRTGDSYPVGKTEHEHTGIKGNPETEALSSVTIPQSNSKQIFLPGLAQGQPLPCPILIPTRSSQSKFSRTPRSTFQMLSIHA